MDIENIVSDQDTENLDNEITVMSEKLAEWHLFDNEDIENLKLLVAKAMKLGELYAKRDAKTQAAPKNTKTVYLVWNKSHCECVGFTDKQDAKYASTGRQTSIAYSSLAGEFREMYEDDMDGNNFDISEIQIEAQEQSHD